MSEPTPDPPSPTGGADTTSARTHGPAAAPHPAIPVHPAYPPPPSYPPPPVFLPPGAGSPASPAHPAVSPVGAPHAAAHSPGEHRRTPGIVALALAILALVGPTVAGGIAAFSAGLGLGEQLRGATSAPWDDLSFLSPVRGWVLLVEVAFWAGTALGVWAIAQGTVAIVRGRGRGQGIAAVIIAPSAFLAFGFVVYALALAGLAVSGGL